MIGNYSPANWYWYVGGDQTKVFSSASNSYVPVTDAVFLAWTNTPTNIDSEASLHSVLANAGIPPYAPVTPRQARLALYKAGLLDQVESAVKAAGGSVQIEWDYASSINRYDALVTSIGSALTMTDDQLDTLFRYASTL